MFRTTQARKDWHSFKQRFPTVEKTPGFVPGFGSRLDDAEAKWKAAMDALTKCERALLDFSKAVEAEAASITTLRYAYKVNAGVVEKAAKSNPAMLTAWKRFVNDSGIEDLSADQLRELRRKAETVAPSLRSVHGLVTHA